MRHRRVIEDSVKTEMRYHDELEAATKKIANIRSYMRKLIEEGSLIKAQFEQERIDEHEATAERLREMIDSGEGKTEIYESYDEITFGSIYFFRELDHASSLVMANAMLGPDGARTLSNQLRRKLEYLRESLERENPISKETQPMPNHGSGLNA